MSNLAVRIVSALILILVGFSALVFNVYTRWAFISLGLVLGSWEFSRMISAKLGLTSAKYAVDAIGEAGQNDVSYPTDSTSRFQQAWPAALIVLLFALFFFPNFETVTGITNARIALGIQGLALLTVLSMTLIGFRYIDITHLAPWIYLQIFGCLYFGIYAAALFQLVTPIVGWHGIFPLLLVQIAVATADTGAYITGRAFGKRKLCPTISSGKTVEGAIGGAILTVLAVMLLGPIFTGTVLWQNLILGFTLSIFAILGDLFISILKRYAGFKDSSNLIPGHGGILDRFDALFFTAPAAVFLLHLFQA